MNLRKLLTFLVSVSMIGLCGCPPITNTVTITYEEAANFSEFDAPNGSGGLPVKTFASGLFVAYKIDSIQNTASGATDFAWDPSLVYVNTAPQSVVVGGTLAPFSTATARVVPKQTVSGSLGRIIIDVQGNPNDIKNADNNLNYHTPAGESVLFVRKAATKQFLDPGTPSNLP